MLKVKIVFHTEKFKAVKRVNNSDPHSATQVLQSVLMHAGELKVVCVLVEAMLQRHSQKTRWRRHLETVQRKFLHTKGISREKVRSDDGKEKVRDIIMGSLETWLCWHLLMYIYIYLFCTRKTERLEPRRCSSVDTTKLLASLV